MSATQGHRLDRSRSTREREVEIAPRILSELAKVAPEGVHPRERIIACVQDLSSFLPLYNEAAEQAAGYRFDPALVRQFDELWTA